MDLVQTVRKEGSRGGVDFSWDSVKNSARRENYLGHSLMAPVGRWQKNKDLGWYAKAEDAELSPEERAEREQERKREELRKVKEAEEDAMAKALGLPPPDRANANMEPLGMSKEKQSEVNQALKEALGDAPTEGETRSSRRGERRRRERSGSRERRRGKDDNERGSKRRHRSRSRGEDRDRERRHRHRHHSRERSGSGEHKRHRSRSRDRRRDSDRGGKRREDEERQRSRDRERRRHKSRSRSRSPYHGSEKRRHRDSR